jgi:hypothetical protein
MYRNVLLLLSLLTVLTVAPSNSTAGDREPLGPPIALVRFEHMGLQAYARLYGTEGDYLLVGASPADLAELRAADLDLSILDSDIRGAIYYLSYSLPVQSYLEQPLDGRLLLDDGVQALLRLDPTTAAQLTKAGAQLSALDLKAKPLEPTFDPEVIPAVGEPDPFIQSLIDQVSSDTAYQYVGDLSGEWPVDIGGQPFTIASRYTYSGVYILKATQYVAEHLEALGLDVEYHVWDDPRYPNIIGELQGAVSPEKIYIICAHLDDAPFEIVAPGADDDASGSAAVLIAADILSQYQWDSTLRFVLFTGEEQWSMDEYYAHGSYPYVQRSQSLGENIVGVLNLDMIGWNSESMPEPAIDLHANASPTLSPTVELAQLFADVVESYQLNLEPDIYPNAAGLGDHGSFWDYGYFAILGIEDLLDFNPFYHSQYDQLRFFDLAYFTDFVKASVGTFAHMSSGTQPFRKSHFQYLPLVVRDAGPTISHKR